MQQRQLVGMPLLIAERKAPPPEYRMRGRYGLICPALCVIVIGFGLYMLPATLAP